MTGSVPTDGGTKSPGPDLAVVADEDPSPAEDPLHLVVEDARIGVERAVMRSSCTSAV